MLTYHRFVSYMSSLYTSAFLEQQLLGTYKWGVHLVILQPQDKGFSMVTKTYLLFTYFFLPLVPFGVAGRLKCLSAARRVACRSDIP